MYRLIQDEDFRWYVCKSEDYAELSSFFDDLDIYWNTPTKYNNEPEPTTDIEYVRINSYRSISFDSFEID